MEYSVSVKGKVSAQDPKVKFSDQVLSTKEVCSRDTEGRDKDTRWETGRERKREYGKGTRKRRKGYFPEDRGRQTWHLGKWRFIKVKWEALC